MPTALHDDGTIVGFTNACGSLNYRAFRRLPTGELQILPLPPGAFGGTANDIAPDGTIVGSVDVPIPNDSTYLIAVWSSAGVVMASMPNPTDFASGNGAGNGGLAVGDCGNGWTGPLPCAWQNGKYVPVPRALAALHGRFNDVNRFGVVVGSVYATTGFIDGKIALWFGDGSVTLLEPPRGYPGCEAVDVNASCSVAGMGRTSPAAVDGHGFLWRDGEAIDLGLLPNYTMTDVRGMNDLDQVVGMAWNSPSSLKPFLWRDGQMYDLTQLAPPPVNAYYDVAQAINNTGQIAILGGRPPNKHRIFLLTPLSVAAADVTVDCAVDVRDLNVVLACWGPRSTSPVERADIDGDGTIGPRDLAEVLAGWTP
ncbi:MAG: hypothetical protein U0572_14020 [Phycisphaerales bacterium]